MCETFRVVGLVTLLVVCNVSAENSEQERHAPLKLDNAWSESTTNAEGVLPNLAPDASTHEDDDIGSFINRYDGMTLLSTGAEVVDFTGALYNVTGSTKDPKAVDGHKGTSWKKLLNEFEDFSEATCYVTDPMPDDTSNHPEFSVGGHMTPNSSGNVESGEVTYLMPLCKWHNSTARDGIAFNHDETRMLKLTGFMEGDSAITFALRHANEHIYTLLYRDQSSTNWAYRELSSEEGHTMLQQSLMPMSARISSQDYALFERRDDVFFIVQSNTSRR